MQARSTLEREKSSRLPLSMALLACSFLFISHAAAQNTSSDSGFRIETELLLEVLLDGTSLDTSILAYKKEGKIFLSFAELMDAVRFPINTDAATGQAGGWFITEEREFLLDLNQDVVFSDNLRFEPGDGVVVFENQIFVALPVIENWLPLKLEPFIRQLALNVTPVEPIPLQKSIQRRSSRVAGGIGAISREPELPFQETPYELIGRHATNLRVNTSSALRDADDSSTSFQSGYSLLSRGDLAWMTSTIALTGNDQDEVTDGRIKLERNLEESFRYVDYLELGDVDTGSRGALIRGGGAEAGVQGTFSDESVDLRGDVPPGWEVELYRNGVLIDVQVVGDAAQYEFLEVPLEFGENRFEFVLYGPFGEEKRDERIVFAGSGLNFGEVSYSLSAVQDGESLIEGFQATQKGDEGTGRYRGSLNLGLGFDTTARLNVDSFEVDGDRLYDASIGFSTSFAKVQTSLGYNSRERSLDSITGQVRGRLGQETSATLRYSEFVTAGLSEQLIPEDRNLWSLDSSLASRIFANPFNLNVNHDERQSSSLTRASFGTTIPTPWSRVSKAFFYQRQEQDGNVDGSSGGTLNLSIDHDPWRFRSGGAYSISPKSQVTSVFGSANIQIDRAMRLNFDVTHNPLGDYTNYRMGFSWALDYVQISPQVSYDSNERWVGLVSFSTSFNPRPGRYLPAIDRLSQAGYGAVHARVFMDDNGNGIWNENEEGLGDARIHAVQAFRTTESAEDGDAYLTRLRSDYVTDIAIDPLSLPDFDLDATTPGASVRPRPGSWSTVDFPVVRTMELEGYVRHEIDGGKELVPAPRVLVRLLDSEGKSISQQRTVFDGFYLFSDVAPGTYNLELRGELDGRLVEKPGQITVTSAGGVIRDLNFTIAAESRALIVAENPDSTEESDSPRTIVPATPEDVRVISEALPEESSDSTLASDSGPASVTFNSVAEKVPPPEGTWHVQFGAFSEEDNARRRWDDLQASGVLPDGQQPRYHKVGDLVRLLTNEGLPEDDARALCGEVKASGAGDCLVRQLDD